MSSEIDPAIDEWKSSVSVTDKFDPLVTAYVTYDGGKPDVPKIMSGATIRAYYNRLLYEWIQN